MRLKPAVSQEVALAWLVEQARSTWEIEVTDAVIEKLSPTARAMAVVSAFDVPDDVEPWLL